MTGFIYLASQSPRRRELLQQIGVRFQRLGVDVPEEIQPGEAVPAYAQRLALAKAQAGWQALKQNGLARAPVLGADTLGLMDGRVLEKPRDRADGIEMLMAMSGREHSVLSSICLCDGDRALQALAETKVQFRSFSEAEAQEYWQTGEPVDKAGAYGIQGRGAALVASIEGSYSAVVGLPIETLLPLLNAFNVPIWQDLPDE